MTFQERIERSEALNEVLNFDPINKQEFIYEEILILKGNLNRMNRVVMNFSETSRMANKDVAGMIDTIKEMENKVDNIEKEIVDIKGLLGKILEKVDK
jgi:hypothetical protein